MSVSKRCLQSCLRSLRASTIRPPRATAVPAATRYYGVDAAASRSMASEDAPPRRGSERYPGRPERERAPRRGAEEEEDNTGGLWSQKPRDVHLASEGLANHLNTLFTPLTFPPDLAYRILTHSSHPNSKHGSCGNLSFIGRRVLDAYLNLFIAASENLEPQHDLVDIVSRVSDRQLLGEHLGSRWGYNKVMQWSPAVSRSVIESSEDPAGLLRKIGMYTVQGDCVSATLGAVYYHFGASVAQRFFHTRMLPNLCVKGGLPLVFHAEAQALAKRMGGPDGNLLHATGKSQFDDNTPAPTPTPSSASS